jgi:iron complex outermembrane receptor protein
VKGTSTWSGVPGFRRHGNLTGAEAVLSNCGTAAFRVPFGRLPADAHRGPSIPSDAMRPLLLLLLVWLLFRVNPARAQEAAKDSLRTYDLAEIVIGGQARQDDRSERVYRVDLASLTRQDASDVASTLRLLPSASLQTNSRGETLVYIRAAGERQVALFLDGAPLNVAWDNRVDLSMVPATVLGGMSVERGAVGPGYGTNVSGGAVNLQSRRLSADGTISELTAQRGGFGEYQYRGLFAGRSNGRSFLLGASRSAMDGMARAGSARLPFEPDADVRVNTDRVASSVYLRMDREGASGRIGLTLLHADAEKGVAPEGHLDPATESVRYWRYPLWQYSMAILNGVGEAGLWQLSGSAWLSRFRQDIADYPDVTYDAYSVRQEDRDRGAGFRFVGERRVGPVRLRAISVVSAGEHRQQEVAAGAAPQRGPEERYRSLLHTVGGEVTSVSNFPGHWVVGASLDGLQPIETGAFPSPGSFHAWSLNMEWHRRIGRLTTFKVNAGSKPRFPTMRELFGTALARFVTNPDLKPERTWMAEFGVEVQRDALAGVVTAFVNRTVDTIDQEQVIVNGERKRRRVNLEGSRVWGIEGQASARLLEDLSFQGHATWMRPIGFEQGRERHLVEKPEVLATMTSRWEVTRGIVLDTGLLYTGRAWSQDLDNALVALPTSWRFNARLAFQRFFAGSGVFAQLFGGVNNITDALHLPQLGLPDAGRTWRVGASLSR